MARQVDMHNSHYLNERKRIFPKDKYVPWADRDGDYNIRSGITFGETEQETIEKQGWDGRERK